MILAQYLLELPGEDGGVLAAPHLHEELREACHSQGKRRVLLVALQEVLDEAGVAEEALQASIHETGVAKVTETALSGRGLYVLVILLLRQGVRVLERSRHRTGEVNWKGKLYT